MRAKLGYIKTVGKYGKRQTQGRVNHDEDQVIVTFIGLVSKFCEELCQGNSGKRGIAAKNRITKTMRSKSEIMACQLMKIQTYVKI